MCQRRGLYIKQLVDPTQGGAGHIDRAVTLPIWNLCINSRTGVATSATVRTMNVIKIDTKLQWLVSKTPSGAYVAVCPPLGIASQGTDQVDLWLNIQESIQLVLNDLLVNGELHSFLRDKGWKAVPVPRRRGDSPYPFEVPMELVMQRQSRRGSARAIN
jgi:predicted RNase H-like HicB family nuclease